MKFLLFLISLIPLITFSQISLKGLVFSQEGKPLPYTNLVSITKQIGATTDTNGIYHLNKLSINDTIKVTNISFEPLLIPVKLLLKSDTIFLSEKIVLLDEVLITDFKHFRDNELIGHLNYKMNYSFSGSSSGVGMYIENKRKIPGWLKELIFRTRQEGPCRHDLRIRFIGYDTIIGTPTTDLIHENIIINGQDLNRTNKIDLSDYKILLPEGGVVVLFEWLDMDPNCTEKTRLFIRGNMNWDDDQMWFNFKDKEWYKVPRTYPTGKYAGLNIGLSVAY